jgi:hypothetical protein
MRHLATCDMRQTVKLKCASRNLVLRLLQVIFAPLGENDLQRVGNPWLRKSYVIRGT